MEHTGDCKKAYITDSPGIDATEAIRTCTFEHNFSATLPISAPDEVLDDADRDCGSVDEPLAKRAKSSMPLLIDSDVECDDDRSDDSDAKGAAVETADAFLKRTINMSYYDYCMTCDSQIPDLPVAHWKPA
jgi:hypothetical protein